MKNLLPIIQSFLQNLNPLWYLAIIGVLIIISIITKNYKALKAISEEGIKMSAHYFNSNEGQKKYKIIKNPNNGTCKGCAFINSKHCELAKPKCSKLLGYGEDSIIVEVKE